LIVKPYVNTYIFNLSLLILVGIILGCTTENNLKKNSNHNDSVNVWLKNAKKKTLNNQVKKSYLVKALELNEIEKEDSVKNHNLLKIALLAKRQNHISFFKKVNKQAYELSIKLKDTSALAETHWNYGSFYSGHEILDSAYYHYSKSFKYYELVNHEYYSGKMLYNMALIQSRLKDYIGSETNLFQAISKFKSKKKYLSLYKSYNLLGNIFKELKNYKKSIEFHQEALYSLNHLKNIKTYREGVYNNIALTYQQQGKYKVAITYFRKAINAYSLYSKNPKLYARLIDNFAYTRHLSNDTSNVKKDLFTSLKIRDSLNDQAGVVINKLHLAEYYLSIKDTVKAVSYAKEANTLALNITNNRDVLASSLLLSKIDLDNSSQHYSSYITLTEELQQKERKLRNKFARIRFETDEHIKEADKQSSEKIMVAVISITVIIILLLLYFVRHQRAKNKELIMESEQQRANQNIYSLLLKQHTKLEEGRLNERHRIAQELHDGLLGKIFATRMRLDFLDIEGDDKTQEKYQLYLGELQEIEKEMRVISHELKNELLNSKVDYAELISNLVEEQSEISNFKYDIRVDDTVNWSLISDVIKINYYRVIQEAVYNISKYAKATDVSICFSFEKNILQLIIKDNGVGFDVSKKQKGIGLKNIATRIKKLKGIFVLSSILDEGTLLTLSVPVDDLTTGKGINN